MKNRTQEEWRELFKKQAGGDLTASKIKPQQINTTPVSSIKL